MCFTFKRLTTTTAEMKPKRSPVVCFHLMALKCKHPICSDLAFRMCLIWLLIRLCAALLHTHSAHCHCPFLSVPLISLEIPLIQSTLYCGLLRVKCGVSFILLLANRFSPFNANARATHKHAQRNVIVVTMLVSFSRRSQAKQKDRTHTH